MLARLDRIGALDRTVRRPASCSPSCAACSARRSSGRARGRPAAGTGRRWSSASARRRTGHNRQVIAHWDDVESGRAEAGHMAGSGPISARRPGRRRSASTRIQYRSGQVVDAVPPSDGGGGDLLRPRRVGRLPAPERRVRGQRRRLHRPPGGGDAHAPRGRRRPRRARVRRARRDRGCAPAAGGRVVARRLLGRGGRRSAPVGARGRSRRAGGAGAGTAPREGRPRRRRRGRPRGRQLAAAGAAGRLRAAGPQLGHGSRGLRRARRRTATPRTRRSSSCSTATGMLELQPSPQRVRGGGVSTRRSRSAPAT